MNGYTSPDIALVFCGIAPDRYLTAGNRRQRYTLIFMIFRFATLLVLGILLAVIWLGHAPYLHDFGEWVFQSKVLALHWTQPEVVAGFQWTGYPVPNMLAVLVMAFLGLFLPAILSAKIFLTLLLTGWYLVLRRFAWQIGSPADSEALLFVLFSLVGLSSFFWTGFVGYQLALLLFTLFLTRFNPLMSMAELAVFAALIFLSHAMVFLVFALLVLLEMIDTPKRGKWALALFPAGVLSLWFVIGRSQADLISPLADTAMSGWTETFIYKLGYPLMLGPFKNLLQPDLSSLLDGVSWLYWTGFLANVVVVTAVGVFILLVVLGRNERANAGTSETGTPRQSLKRATWVLSFFYVFAPYDFFGLINPSGRITVPLLLICLLMASGTPILSSTTRSLRMLASITLVFTFFTVFTYLVLMHRATSPAYLASRPSREGNPPSSSVLDYNTWVYSQARYDYFNYRIFGFSKRFEDIELAHYNTVGFRTSLLVGYKEPR